jgi:UDP-N-acetylglucosamine 4,6-dehydratase/5-epimerase
VRYFIAGGTGSLGRGLTKALLEFPHAEITIFSRDELKQKEMAAEFDSVRLRFIVGDIRDRAALERALPGHEVVFNVAALKHVDVAEANPEESLKTNVLGAINVADAAISSAVPFVVFSSTDKAVSPINAYGMCKGLSERILFARNRSQDVTRFSVFRWGNVTTSRGAFLHLLRERVRNREPVPLTDVEMTRFWIRIEDAVKFMLDHYADAPKDRALVPPMKAAPVTTLALAVAEVEGVTEPVRFKDVGIRRGEKLHEVVEDWGGPGTISSQLAPQYSVSELAELIR